jgi:hypothetical protein
MRIQEKLIRDAARAAGEKWYFTGKPCKRGHIALRQMANKGCKECQRENYLKWERANSKQRRDEKKARRLANPQQAAVVAKRSREKNRERCLARCRARYYAKRGEYIAANKKRKASIKSQTPPWADHSLIKQIYIRAAELTDSTGIEHHVDHDIPLRGRVVSGLHVHTNLVIRTRTENMAKYNKWPYANSAS